MDFKEARRKYDREWHQKHKATQNARKKQRRKEIQLWFRELKSTLKCVKCGENHPGCLEFHHVGEKDDNVSLMVARSLGRDRILAEIAKCEVLCANCHGKHHWEERLNEE
jgi:L-lactate utilization protein LutB